MTKEILAKMIDHTVLKATATQADIEKVCKEALEYNFASVCVSPCWVSLAAELLEESDVMVCTVAGFPLGTSCKEIKAAETEFAVASGAEEVDMVINVADLKEGRVDKVTQEIAAVVDAAAGRTVKVIVECCYLTPEEIATVTQAVIDGGAHFVKTSTGMATYGARVEDVKIMKKVAGNQIQIKAAGGIRTLADALAMAEAGANRIGASASIAILAELS